MLVATHALCVTCISRSPPILFSWQSSVRLSASVRSELDDFDRRESAPGLHLSDERAVSGSRLGNALSPVRDASGKTAI